MTLPSRELQGLPSPERDHRAAPSLDARAEPTSIHLHPYPRRRLANGPASQTVPFPRQDNNLGIYDPSIYTLGAAHIISRFARVEPRFAHGLAHDWPAVDELLVVVRALREELVVIHCEKG
jgi:hypothetical protein